jgi:hypothetical protein
VHEHFANIIARTSPDRSVSQCYLFLPQRRRQGVVLEECQWRTSPLSPRSSASLLVAQLFPVAEANVYRSPLSALPGQKLTFSMSP